MLLEALVLVADDDVDLVLADDDLVEVHDLDGGQVLTGLVLRARLIACNQEQSTVHDSGTSKHRCHKHIVTRAVDEGDVAPKEELAAAVLAGSLVLLLGSIRLVALWLWAFWTLEQFGIRVAESDCDVSDLLFLESDGLYHLKE